MMMMNPRLDTKYDTLWNMHDLVNDLIDDLRMTRGNFVSEIARELDDSEKSSHILNVLEYYDTLVLEEIQNYMKKYKSSLFEIIQKRRLAYVEKVRSRPREHDDKSNDNMIDLSRDQDDTANLARGMEVIGRGVDKIEEIIQNKKLVINQRKKKENLRWWEMFSTFVAVFILAYIIGLHIHTHFIKI
jgi:hypothetical protein